MGPAGGNGGRGGSVYATAVRDTHLLAKYKSFKEFRAERGEDGGSRSVHGADGPDFEVQLPVGSVLTNLTTGEKFSLTSEGEKILLLRGGAGGRGNESFKRSTNVTPKESTPGKPGEEAEFLIELELVADIGLIGFPNAGKTSLLNELSRSQGKVADYPFTTLEPALGEMYGFIIADIPGLIEGAAEGKGLGHKFLRHIRRTKMLVHLISLENEDPADAYKKIRNELEKFDPELLNKKEIVVLTKTDLCEPSEVKSLTAKIRQITPIVEALTVYDDQSIKDLRDSLIKELTKD
jgi:GTPase